MLRVSQRYDFVISYMLTCFRELFLHPELDDENNTCASRFSLRGDLFRTKTIYMLLVRVLVLEQKSLPDTATGVSSHWLVWLVRQPLKPQEGTRWTSTGMKVIPVLWKQPLTRICCALTVSSKEESRRYAQTPLHLFATRAYTRARTHPNTNDSTKGKVNFQFILLKGRFTSVQFSFMRQLSGAAQ